MLLLREEGLDSCPQECWSVYPRTVAEFVGIPQQRMLFCGMSIGHANAEHPVNQFRSQRAALEQFASFHGI
jgi:nitroreductase